MKTHSKDRVHLKDYRSIPKTYRELCQIYLPRPIHNAAEDALATEMMNALAVFPKLNREQQDYLDVLTDFVDTYDQARKMHWRKVGGVEVLRTLLEEHGLTAADLSRILSSSRNLGAMILRGDRNLTLAHIHRLSAHFKVKPELFIS